MSYIDGVIDGYAVGVITSAKERTMACKIRDGVTAKELGLIVLHYMKDNPAELHLQASVVTMKAIDKAFPCN